MILLIAHYTIKYNLTPQFTWSVQYWLFLWRPVLPWLNNSRSKKHSLVRLIEEMCLAIRMFSYTMQCTSVYIITVRDEYVQYHVILKHSSQTGVSTTYCRHCIRKLSEFGTVCFLLIQVRGKPVVFKHSMHKIFMIVISI